MTSLVLATDKDFDWMLAGASSRSALCLPPGGVDEPGTLAMLRGMFARVLAAHGTGSWMMVADGEIVGLCGYKRPADRNGIVEIGYGVAPSRRRQGHATRAVAAMLVEAARDPLVKAIVAETAVDNAPSQRALAANGFLQNSTRYDAEDGTVVCWRFFAPSAKN